MSSPRHALVLAAGLGTRLRPLTFVRAKPALPVGGEPLVRRILEWLARSGVTDVVLNLHHLPTSIASVVGDGADLGLRARYSWEHPRVLGSAGGPRLASPIVGAATFFIVNGDTLTDVDLSALADAHASARARVTLALTPNRNYLRYGGVCLDTHRRVTGFVSRGPRAEGSFHFVGAQVVEADAFASVAPGEPANSIGDVYDRLIAARPGSVAGFVSEPSFHDIGTVEDYVRTARAFGDASQAVGASVHVDPTARVSDSILWNDIRIGAECVIDACVVTDGVRVPNGSTCRHAILLAEPSGLVSVPLEPGISTTLQRPWTNTV